MKQKFYFKHFVIVFLLMIFPLLIYGHNFIAKSIDLKASDKLIHHISITWKAPNDCKNCSYRIKRRLKKSKKNESQLIIQK